MIMEKAEVLRNEILGATLVKNLEKRGFAAYYCATREQALAKALELIPPTDVVAWGGSVSIQEIGLLDAVKKRNAVIDRDAAVTPEERNECLRKALLSDTFLMSCNAMSKDGELVNIDGNGNRIAAFIFGPKQVLVIAGVNKITGSLEEALARARSTAAPINAARFPGVDTPCAKTGVCLNCAKPESLCSQILVTRTCRNAGRVKIIIVGEHLGF